MDTPEKIRMLLQNALQPTRLEVIDESGAHAGHLGARSGGGHYAVLVVSAKFEGASTLERHRMIYSALGTMMQQEIHALAIQACTKKEPL